MRRPERSAPWIASASSRSTSSVVSGAVVSTAGDFQYQSRSVCSSVFSGAIVPPPAARARGQNVTTTRRWLLDEGGDPLHDRLRRGVDAVDELFEVVAVLGLERQLFLV